MKINFNQVLVDLDGKELFENNAVYFVDKFLEAANKKKIEIPAELLKFAEEYFAGTKETMTLKSVSLTALTRDTQDEGRTLKAEEKIKRFLLAQKIVNADKELVELEAAEIKMLEDCIGAKYPTGTYGLAYVMLESKN
jgi:hypothetical protein